MFESWLKDVVLPKLSPNSVLVLGLFCAVSQVILKSIVRVAFCQWLILDTYLLCNQGFTLLVTLV